MRNVNFSADMVGIQTLAQQGIVCGSESVLSAGVTEGGSFEDMILQMIANNLTIEPAENEEQISDVFTDKNEKNPQELLMDSLMCGIVAPEISIQDFSEIYSDNVSVQQDEVGAVSGKLLNLSDNVVASAEKVVSEQAIIVPKDTVADVRSETKIDFPQFKQAHVEAETAQHTDFTDEKTVKTEINSEIKAENRVSEPKKQENSDFRIVKPYAKADHGAHAESDDTESETADNMPDKSFISTSDMLQMRLGNKVAFSDERVMIKVAQAPVDIESPNAVRELTDRILMKFNEKEFEVELYPKSLGKIAISLVLDNGIVKVAMSAENAKVNAFLASQSSNIQSIVEKNTQYSAVVKVDDSQDQYQQQQRDNSQYGADENQKQRQQEHMQQMYRQNIQHTEDFLSMLNLV